jgi:hypothetical protein
MRRALDGFIAGLTNGLADAAGVETGRTAT